jgi:hypothetical protein
MPEYTVSKCITENSEFCMLLAERSIICIYYESITISITCIVEAIDCTLTVSTLIGHLVFGLETLLSLLCEEKEQRLGASECSHFRDHAFILQLTSSLHDVMHNAPSVLG